MFPPWAPFFTVLVVQQRRCSRRAEPGFAAWHLLKAGSLMAQRRYEILATLPSSDTEAAMNSVNLVGNLATDVELRELDPERKVASFLLAIDRPGNADADFVV